MGTPLFAYRFACSMQVAVICGGMLCAIPSEAAATFEEEFAARCGRTPAKIGRVIEGESGHIHVVE